MDGLGALTALTAQHLETFLLVFCRLGAMLALVPLLGHRAVPVVHRAGLALVLALILTPLVGDGTRAPAADLATLAVAVAGELLVGVAIGFVASLVLAAVEGAGELVGLQMGFGVTAVLDPSTGGQATVLARFQHVLALLLFLTLDGHHLVLQATAASFRRLRPGAVVHAAEMAAGLVGLGGAFLRAGLELAAPLVGLLLVVNVALALLARVAPQTNVFLLGLPLTIALGIVAVVETLPYFSQAVATLIQRMAVDLDGVLGTGTRGLP